MGEAADDILDGTTCQQCGTWMEDILNGADPPGHPRLCAYCQIQESSMHSQPAPEKVNCAVCHKRVKAAGLHDHMRAVHPAK